MPGRKQNGRKKRDRRTGHRSSREESTKGKEIVDEDLVKSRAIKGARANSFSDGGFGCSDCAWKTPKKGMSGIQALRAHSKVHVRDRRAVVNTYIVQATVLIVSIVLAITPMLLQISLSDVVSDIRFYDSVATELIVLTTAVVSIFVAVSVLHSGDQFTVKGKRRWRSMYTWSIRLLMVFMLLVASLSWLEARQHAWLLWFAPILIPWAAWLSIGTGVARTRLTVRRGVFKPRNQRKLLRSKNKLTDHRVGIFRRSVRMNIGNGLIVLSKLSKKRRNSYDRLGVGDTRLSLRSQRWRLGKEEHNRRETKRSKLMSKQSQDRQNRRDNGSSRDQRN